MWRAILPVLLLLSHVQDSWRVFPSPSLSAVLLPSLQKSVFIAAILAFPTPLSHIHILISYILIIFFITDIESC